MTPRRQRWWPELNEDVTEEILLRIPPEEPAHLFRASVVCKLWLRIASYPAFLHRYRAFHGRVPLLGFFHHPEPAGSFPRFVPTTAASSPPQPGYKNWIRWVSDCRDGRVLLEIVSARFGLAVWDPFSGHWEEMETPRSLHRYYSNAMVLCAVHGCDHRSCRSGPFHVVCAGLDRSNSDIVRAHVFSSESRSWYTPASAQLDHTAIWYFDMNRAALVGDGLYCTVDYGTRILKHDLVEHRLSVIDMPHQYVYVPVLMQNEDGSLGVAGVSGSRLDLWSRMVNAEEVTGWVKRRVIKLKEILPVDIISNDQADVIVFAEGVEVFFITTNAGAFTFELNSGRVRKVGKPDYYHCVIPFISFFTPDWGCHKWTK